MASKREDVVKKLADKGFTKETFANMDFRGKVEFLYKEGFTKEEIVIATGKIANTVRLAIESIGKERKVRAGAVETIVEIPAETLETLDLTAFTPTAKTLIEQGYNDSSIAKALKTERAKVARVRKNKELEDNALI